MLGRRVQIQQDTTVMPAYLDRRRLVSLESAVSASKELAFCLGLAYA